MTNIDGCAVNPASIKLAQDDIFVGVSAHQQNEFAAPTGSSCADWEGSISTELGKGFEDHGI